MSDNDEENGDVGLAKTRSRRERNVRSRGRKNALEAFKKARADGRTRDEEDEEDVDNVYEYVDENKYAEIVSNRQNDDWLVGEENMDEYYEDGREIFDEDLVGDGKATGKKASAAAAKKSKREQLGSSKINASSEDNAPTSMQGRSIKNMLANMPKKKAVGPKGSGSGGGTAAAEDQDDILSDLLGKIKQTPSSGSAKKPVLASVRGNAPRPLVKSAAGNLPMTRKATGLTKPVASKRPLADDDEEAAPPPAPSQVIEEFASQDEDGVTQVPESMEMEDDVVIDDDDAIMAEMADDDLVAAVPEPATTEDTISSSNNRGFVQTESAKAKEVEAFQAKKEEIATVEVDACTLPLMQNASGEKVLRMYWLDAYEDPFKHAGTVWLFGKVWIEKARAHVSCCVSVKNIERNVFLLKRDNKFDLKAGRDCVDEEGDPVPVSIGDVYQEFNSKMAVRYKIPEFKSKPSRMSYAFQLEDVPDVADYLEILYSPKYQALPSDLKGETFSRVFAANQSTLERFLLSRKIKGPSWIDIKMAAPSNPQTSWCKVEAVCQSSLHVSVVMDNPPPPPPLSVLALNLKSVVNAKTLQNEIAIVSGLIHPNFYLDRPAPRPAFTSHFCAMTRPSDEVWPFDLQKVMQAHPTKVDKMESERSLLGFLLAKIGKLDPDIIIGHDISGFDLDVILHRAVVNKIPNWSRLGRLKRSVPPFSSGKGGRVNDKQAVTGRLVCDLKISAKELIRCKSYDLPSLAEKLVPAAKSAEERFLVDPDVMRASYTNSKELLNCANVSLMDASDTLQCICELNALPLALQITKVAGNVMSRTLLGGRAERNEYLLLHAFTEKGYLVPDKQYGKKVQAETDMMDGGGDEGDAGKKGGKSAASRRKPAYAGGLVLEPKKGFYDKFILLMDFNSLYPSIIQEYNICFTTVNRNSRPEGGDPSAEEIPDLPSADLEAGVLPTEIRKLVESRRSVKALLKDPNLTHDQRMQYDIRQKALKLTANSMYGCLGFSFSRFFAKPLAALVTSKGREILMQTKELVEKMNLEVIYGDTDSIMINSNSRDYEEVFKLGAQIKQTVNKLYKLLELDIDGVFKYMLLLKKKKYAAVTMEKVKGELVENQELKGLDIVRRDWCQLAANAGREILNFILSDLGADERISKIHEKLESLATDLKAGRIALADLGITKQLTKDPEDYPDKKSLAHVQVALRMNSKGGKKIRAGDTVPYVICDDGSGLAATQRAFHVDEVKDAKSNLNVDTGYYLAQQLHPVVSRLCEPLEGTDSARIAASLGLDPEQYRKSVRVEVTADDQSMVRNEERFRPCTKLTVVCGANGCGESMTLDTSVRGRGRDAVFALARCSKLDCKAIPILEQTAAIQNKITLEIRTHISRYYSGWITCEDPGCSGETRQMPLVFQRAFPVCPACHKATMYMKYNDSQLYLQLLYYQHLFDVQKALDRTSGEEKESLSRCLKVESAADQKSVLAAYAQLKAHVDSVMRQNKFSVVSLNKVFEGLHCVKASRLKSSHHDP